MPIVIYSNNSLPPGAIPPLNGGANALRPILLSDIGKRNIVWKSGIYTIPQSQYISPDGIMILKNTPEVEMSIDWGVIKRFRDVGLFEVEYLPYIQVDVSELDIEMSRL